MEAFKPLDIHPCTVDVNTWDCNISVENLFGHLCSGTTFAHDAEMTAYAANKNRIFEKIGDKNGWQGMTSSREGSAEPCLMQNPDMNRVDALRSASDPNPNRNALLFDDTDRPLKRRRTSSSSASINKAGLDLDEARQPLDQLRKLHEIKKSFESYQKRSKMAAQLPTRIGSTPLSNNGLGVSEAGSSSSSFQTAPEKSLSSRRQTAGLPKGTQIEPIELSDGETPSTDDEVGGFLLDEMPEPDSLAQASDGTQPVPETQLSLSDAAFESQSSRHATDEVRTFRDAFFSVSVSVPVTKTCPERLY